jgi:hypothetical protein
MTCSLKINLKPFVELRVIIERGVTMFKFKRKNEKTKYKKKQEVVKTLKSKIYELNNITPMELALYFIVDRLSDKECITIEQYASLLGLDSWRQLQISIYNLVNNGYIEIVKNKSVIDEPKFWQNHLRIIKPILIPADELDYFYPLNY